MQSEYSEGIPTIRQVHHELKDGYHELDQVLKNMGIVPLSRIDDLDEKKITLRKVLANIPSEERLTGLKLEATKYIAFQKINQYAGDIQLVQKARQNFKDLKKEQQAIYYLSAECDLPSISPQYRTQVIKSNIENLHSYKDIVEVKKTKSKIIQKNTICDTYFEQGNLALERTEQVTIIKSRKNQQLKNGDLLIHVNFYDSHNFEKQYEFVCTQDMILSVLVEKFKCLIDTLNNLGKLSRGGNLESYQVYDKMHYWFKPGRTDQGNRYLVIQDAIYYQGNRLQIQQSINIPNVKPWKYHMFQLSKTKINDIRAIFGRPYLYRHLEGCDHYLIFKQARLFQEGQEEFCDIINKEKYPVLIFESKMKRKKCESCGQNFADFAVLGDSIKNGQNLYVCSLCWSELGQDQKAKVINYIHD